MLFLLSLLETGGSIRRYGAACFCVSCLEILFTCLIIAIIEKLFAKLGGRGESALWICDIKVCLQRLAEKQISMSQNRIKCTERSVEGVFFKEKRCFLAAFGVEMTVLCYYLLACCFRP